MMLIHGKPSLKRHRKDFKYKVEVEEKQVEVKVRNILSTYTYT